MSSGWHCPIARPQTHIASNAKVVVSSTNRQVLEDNLPATLPSGSTLSS
jgi:hypothetical protein